MAKKVWFIRSKNSKFYFLLVLILCVLTGGLLLNQSFLPVFSTKDGPAAFYRAEIDEKEIALTFNISWGEQRAIPILDTLKDHDIKAAFFISGAWAERHPDIVERMVEDGHTLGNHGYRFEHYPRMDNEEIVRDLNLSHKKIKDVTEEDVTFFRPPHGDINQEVLEIIDRFGYDTIHWSIGGDDWKNPGVDTIVTSITRNIQPGDVVLLHASDSAKQTGEALPQIIEKVQAEGYQFVELEELISQADGSVQEIN
ncbi:polysaccharide deacetylase family sporulation protein PdaB [Alteribacillus iranensis]|uniref:Polysaccharide deacetylase family sporulation protein PdaB n=1 Tax=Alteribacillus iranensis TaxID=930128 RepID=A0A1I2F591_9BACI|nr:polysaccharide deacetylase family sporulation protein PdaB [Alteribacillus iranensis]SFF00153.1 polysaccharide deacetylase family sporulation protein PdaB [Alteribacillus iranensis]